MKKYTVINGVVVDLTKKEKQKRKEVADLKKEQKERY